MLKKWIRLSLLLMLLFLIHPVYALESGMHVKTMPHIEGQGWTDYIYDGEEVGTSGQKLRCEALKIFIVDENNNTSPELGIKYRSHVQDIGWQNYVTNGQTSGTTGQSKKIEALQISLIGNQADQYDIYYSTHVENYGWLGWAKNGEPAGSEGYNFRMEAVKIQLLPKGSSEAPESDKPAFESKYGNGSIHYRAHVENKGWLDYKNDGEDAGTTGENLKLEALSILLNPVLPEGKIECSAHIQDIGWENYKDTKDGVGTTGQNKRLEALKLRLTGDLNRYYTINVQVHVQDYGWLDPVGNDEIAGTTGESKKIEAIRIKLVKKNTPDPETPSEEICLHPSTTVKNKVDPTCQQEGYTGDTYCNVCGAELNLGQNIPKVDHNYIEEVITPASKEGKGHSKFTCSYCGTSYEKDYDYNPTAEQVYQDIIALKAQYPEDMPWTNANTYTSQALHEVGGGCHAFALICSDAAFGYLPGRKHNDPNQIRVGDMIRIHNDNHTAVVLEIRPDSVIITEGNYNSDIHWGREIKRADLNSDITYVLTRYPE